jgi:predicted DNA-binding protein (UPF0251 family)
MPKPQGTFLRVQDQEKTRLKAVEAKRAVGLSRQQGLSEFYEALNRMAERDLDSLYRSMASLASDIAKNEPLSQEDKVRKKVSEVLVEVRKVIEKAKDYKQLEGRLQVPVHSVVRAPLNLDSGGAELALVVALCQVLEVLVRIRKRK